MDFLQSFINAITFTRKGIDTVTADQWQAETGHETDTARTNRWSRSKTTYGAAQVNPTLLSQSMLQLYMQLPTERVNEVSETFERVKTKTLSKAEQKRIAWYNREDEV